MLFLDVTKQFTLTTANQKRWNFMTANRNCQVDIDFVLTYVGNRTINMTLVMLFPVGNES